MALSKDFVALNGEKPRVDRKHNENLKTHLGGVSYSGTHFRNGEFYGRKRGGEPATGLSGLR